MNSMQSLFGQITYSFWKSIAKYVTFKLFLQFTLHFCIFCISKHWWLHGSSGTNCSHFHQQLGFRSSVKIDVFSPFAWVCTCAIGLLFFILQRHLQCPVFLSEYSFIFRKLPGSIHVFVLFQGILRSTSQLPRFSSSHLENLIWLHAGEGPFIYSKDYMHFSSVFHRFYILLIWLTFWLHLSFLELPLDYFAVVVCHSRNSKGSHLCRNAVIIFSLNFGIGSILLASLCLKIRLIWFTRFTIQPKLHAIDAVFAGSPCDTPIFSLVWLPI